MWKKPEGRAETAAEKEEILRRVYVIEGFRLACGVDGGPIAAEVHRSNMSKLPATKNADGKVVKGPNYSPPDIAGELRKQGWAGP